MKQKWKESSLTRWSNTLIKATSIPRGPCLFPLQLEELREKMESGEYRFAQGQALGETSIAAKNQAFNDAREQLLNTNSSSNIETVLQCSLEKEEGVEVFLILAVKK
jgi:hypothetical protein